MRNIDVPLAAGVVARFEIPAAYFRLMVGTAVNVRLYQDRGGTYEARNVDAGYYSMPERGFAALEIDSATAQTVRFFVSDGRGGYDRSQGDVTATPADGNVVEQQTVVTVGTTLVSAVAANAATQEVIFQSDTSNTAPIFLTSGTGTAAGAPIRLDPGDTVMIDRGSKASWSAISSAAGQLLRRAISRR
jgi:hypothetical protein